MMWSDSSAHWDNSKGPLFWRAIKPFLVSGNAGGMVTLASQRAGQAGLTWHLDTRLAIATSGMGRRPMPALPRRVRCYVPPLLRVPSFADRAGHARLAGGVLGGTCSCDATQGTVRTQGILPCLSTQLPNRFTPAGMPSFVAQSASRRAPGGAHFHGRLFFGQWSSATNRFGSGGGRQPQIRSLRGSAVRRGQTSRDGEGYAAAMAGIITMDPLTLYIDCEGTVATINGPKCKALGARGPCAHVWSRLLVSHDEVRAIKVKGHAHPARCGGWAHFPSVQKGKRLRRHLCKERS